MNRDKIVSFIKQEFSEGKIRNDLFPMMTRFGVKDYSETVHTMGLNYITAIGRYIDGITAISECPVYPYNINTALNHFAAEENGSYLNNKKEVRPDSIWFSKEDNSPILICEFERYEKNNQKDLKIIEKIENLLVAYHQLGGNIPIILFVYWSYVAENPANIDDYIKIFNNGFRGEKGIYINGINALKTNYIIYRCVASGDSECVRLNQWVEVG